MQGVDKDSLCYNCTMTHLFPNPLCMPLLLCSLYTSLPMFVSFLNIHCLSHACQFHMLTIITCLSYSHVFYFLLCILYLMYKRPPNTALDSSLVLTVNLSHLCLKSLEDLSKDIYYSFIINCRNSLVEPTVANKLDL